MKPCANAPVAKAINNRVIRVILLVFMILDFRFQISNLVVGLSHRGSRVMINCLWMFPSGNRRFDEVNGEVFAFDGGGL